jgi:hypothetical protein
MGGAGENDSRGVQDSQLKREYFTKGYACKTQIELVTILLGILDGDPKMSTTDYTRFEQTLGCARSAVNNVKAICREVDSVIPLEVSSLEGRVDKYISHLNDSE